MDIASFQFGWWAKPTDNMVGFKPPYDSPSHVSLLILFHCQSCRYLISIHPMVTETNHAQLILASKSPRREDLLRQAGVSFAVVPSMVDESAILASAPEEHVRLLAEAKAGDISARFPDRWVIGADTEVVINHCVLGKPRNPSEARTMLLSLSGKSHRVLTGYCLCRKDRGRSISDTVETKVEFRPLTEDDINWYIGTGEPFDKAGGYGVQGFGAVLIKRIEGSYTNVVGLPLCEVMEHLLREGAVQRPWVL